jgi:hypothetical protein
MDAAGSEIFAMYVKEFARRITSALSKGYSRELHEPQLVQVVEHIVTDLRSFRMEDHKIQFEITTKSVMIHGNKSQVEFEYYGKTVQRELGDLIFVISLVHNGRKYFEKLSINQFKKSSKNRVGKSWDLGNKEQLYLLSRFPTFRGVKGSIIPPTEHSLPNYSGCLGSYGLLYSPGDFAFLSATELDSCVGLEKRFRMKDLHMLYLSVSPVPEIEFISYVLGNHQYAGNAFDFAQKYLTMGIGEPTFATVGINNSHARRLLHGLLSAVGARAAREQSRELLDFVKGFFGYPYAEREGEGIFREGFDYDLEGGGIAIVHTTIDLGE